jgi:hypothetical protein
MKKFPASFVWTALTLVAVASAFLFCGCQRRGGLSGVYGAQISLWQPFGTNPKLEFSPDGRVKITNDERFTSLGTYTIASGMVKVTAPSPSSMGNTILEFQIQGDDLNWGGHLFHKQPKNASITSTSTSSTTSPNTTADTDRDEAIKQAEAKWAEVWVRNGDTWLAKINAQPGILEIRGRTTQVNPDTLSEANRLNGIQWQGSVSFTCVAERVFGLAAHQGALIALNGDREYHSGWNDWIEPKTTCAIYRFRKRKGTWTPVERNAYDFAEDVVRPSNADLVAAGIVSNSSTKNDSLRPQTTGPTPAGHSIKESDLLGRWQGSRIGVEYLANHTFNRDGFFRPGMKWQLKGVLLTEWNPVVADRDITPTTPLPGPSVFTIVSLTRDRVVLEMKDGMRFVRYRLLGDSERERESAAGRAKNNTIAENKKVVGTFPP